MTTENVVVAAAAGDPESASCAVNVNEPAVVGLPVMAPVVAFNANPAGSDPVTIDHLYGVIPPLAASVVEYETPTVPLGNGDTVVIDNTVLITSVKLLVTVAAGEAESFARATNVNDPVAVGVPAMVPVDAFRVNPPGSNPLLTDHVYGPVPPFATSVVE